MISNENFNAIYQRIDILESIKELLNLGPSDSVEIPKFSFTMPQLNKTKNRNLIEDYIAKYTGKKNQNTML